MFIGVRYVMFVWEKVPLAVTSMIVCVALVITGVLNITSPCCFIDTNVIPLSRCSSRGSSCSRPVWQNKVGGVINSFLAKQKTADLSSPLWWWGLMSGVPLKLPGTAAVLIPAVTAWRQIGLSRSRLLMPLVLAAALGGGNLSLIGAPEIYRAVCANIARHFAF